MKNGRMVLSAWLVLMICSSASWAQLRIVGAISGTVDDPSGALIPNAKVVLRDEATGITKETLTSAGGNFLFPDLAHGTYEVTVTAPGFQAAVVSQIRVSTSQTTDLKVRLVVGQPTETITVEGVAPILETTTQLVTTTQSAKMITGLPVLGRSNALALARLVPGASPLRAAAPATTTSPAAP